MQKSKSHGRREAQKMSESDSDEDEPNFFTAAAQDDDDEEEEVTFPIGGGKEEESEKEEEEEEVVDEVDLGSPIYVVFNRRVTPKSSAPSTLPPSYTIPTLPNPRSWFSVPRVARTSTIAGVVRCYDRPVVVESAERMGALILDHKAWPTREALLDLIAADQVVVLQGNFKDDPTLRYVWGVLLTTGSSANTEDHRIFRTLPKRAYGELLSAYSKDAELVGSSLLDMESTDNNSRSFNPTICGWQRVTLEGFPRTAAVTPSKDVTAEKLPKPSAKKIDPKVGTIFDSRPSAGSAPKPSATTILAVTRKPTPVRKPIKKAGVVAVVAVDASKNSSASTATAVVAPTEATLSAAAKSQPVPASQRAPVAPTPIIVPAEPPALLNSSSNPSSNPPSNPPVAAAPGLRLGGTADPPNPPGPLKPSNAGGSAVPSNPNTAPTAVSKKRKLTEIFDVPTDETIFELIWPVNAKGAKVTVEYY